MAPGPSIARTLAIAIALLSVVVSSAGLHVAAKKTDDGIEFVVGYARDPGKEAGDDFHGAKVVKVEKRTRYVLVDSKDPDDFKRKAKDDGNIRYVEENRLHQLVQFTPNDPSYSTQYGPQQIRANLAWDTTLGSTSAAVCIVDTGVRYTHQELAGTRWLGGHDFVNNDADPWDDRGHGTHVAGTAAGSINNGVGIAGIANVGFYAVKSLNSVGQGTWEQVASGVTWCADNTMARTVISLSLGGPGGAQVLQDAVSYAYNTKGRLIVASSGNDYCSGTGCIGYPAAYSEVVSVACTTSTEAKCDFSNSGPEAEMAAPGSGILSSCFESNTAYCSKSGTSMSAPHVSGAAALAWGHLTTLTASQLRQRLRDTAQDLGSAGWDQDFGYGEVDAKCLLDGPASCGNGGGGSTLFSENFDDGVANGWSVSGLWHVSNCRSQSILNSLAYNKAGCPTNFDTGVTNSGNAITPSVVIPAGSSNVILSWGSWHATEAGTSFDQKTVSVSTNGGASWTQIWQEDGTQSAWNARSADLTPYAGNTVQIRFRFDTMDSVENAGEGWYVDDVKVTTNGGAGATATVKIFDAGGVNVLYTYTTSLNPANYFRFAAAAAGYNDPLSGEGQIWVDDLVITRADASQTTMNFATPPVILESTTGNTNDAMRYDLAGQRVLAVSDSGYGCSTNYESINTGTSAATKVRFKYSRTTGDIGDGSWWDIYLGLVPSDSEPILGASCATDTFTGVVDNLVGIRLAGDGDGARHWMRGRADAVEDTSSLNQVIGTTYVGEIQVSAAQAPTTPSAPQNVDAAAGPGLGQITVTWAAPATDGGSAVTGYQVYRATTSAGPYALIATLGNVLTYTDSGLGNGATRWYKVSAVNAQGEGAQSAADVATTFGVPTAPQTVDAVAGPGVGELKVNWAAPGNNGGKAVTGYKVYRSTTSGGTYTLIATLGNVLTYTDSGLGNGATRWYKVSAVNEVGEGAQGGPDGATTFTTPGAPQNPTATPGPGAGEIRVCWQPPASDGGTPVFDYNVYDSTTAAGPFTLHYIVGAGLNCVTDSGLGNGATRYYRVSAVNLVGEGPQTATVSGTTFTTPSAPQNLDAQAGPGVGQIRVTWQAPANNGGTPITNYRVYRSSSSGGPFTLLSTVGNVLTYTDSTLGNGVTWCYQVVAVNIVGASPPSNTDCATTFTTPGAPQNLRATPGPGVNEITLDWNPPLDNGGTPVNGYKIYRSTNGAAFVLRTTVGGGTLTFKDTGLTATSTYAYFVKATNIVGEGPASNTVCKRPYPVGLAQAC